MENNKAVIFTNWLSTEFVGRWNGVDYKFKPGQSTMVEEWKALHFAKHAADQYFNEQKLPTNHHTRGDVMGKFIKAEDSVVAEDASALETKILNENKKVDLNSNVGKFCDSCDSKGVRHKKDCPKTKKVDEEFEGLK